MRITNNKAPTRSHGVGAARSRDGGTAGTTKAGAPASSAATAQAAALTSLGAILSVQGVDDALEGKRRTARRGSVLLDGLDDLRLALLDGSLPPETLPRLRRLLSSGEMDDGSDDAKALIAEIELRVEVELAKIECALDRERGG